MLFRRYGTFVGGIDLHDDKDATLAAPICSWDHSTILRIPLWPCSGQAANLVVKPGERVARGDKLALSADSGGVDVFAPQAGTVGDIVKVDLPCRNGIKQVDAMVLGDLTTPDGPPIPDLDESFDWQGCDGSELRLKLSGGGLTTHCGPTVGIEHWVQQACSKKNHTIILNGVESQPYITSNHRILVERGSQVIRGLAILAEAIQAETVFVAVDRKRTGDYSGLLDRAGRFEINHMAMLRKYPIGDDIVLTKVLTRREVPPGGSPMDVGTAVIDAATCFAVYRWVACGEPQTHRVVTVSGEHAPKCGNYYLPMGTDCTGLVGHLDEGAVICGGPMVGSACTDATVVTPGLDAVLAIDAASPPAPTPCIRCGWCTDHCPTRLNVSALNDMAELSEIAQAEQIGALACVECGVCSYVCPARLPLAQRVKRLKRAIFTLRAQAIKDSK